MSDCIFCKIASKEIPSTVVYEDEQVVAFKDLEPQAPVHVLVIPKKHVESVAALKEEDKELAAHILVDVIPQLAQELGVAEKGFRVVANTGDEGGQTVKHLHFHLLGGRSMQWPPG
jgi:histidine triad (HIT) family protein